jgi:hypothetical protein
VGEGTEVGNSGETDSENGKEKKKKKKKTSGKEEAKKISSDANAQTVPNNSTFIFFILSTF